jgi:hypothetical protein
LADGVIQTRRRRGGIAVASVVNVQPRRSVTMSASARLAHATAIASLAALAAHGGPANAQVTRPAGGTTGTVAVEGTIDAVSPHGLAVKTTDGTTQLFRLLEKIFVHDASPRPDDELSGLHRGMTVVVHYSGTGDSATVQEIDRLDGAGLKITEGRVTAIDRNRGEIKVRLENGTTETLRLSNRVSRHVGRDLDNAAGTRVIVYYTDDQGVKEVHYFRSKR